MMAAVTDGSGGGCDKNRFAGELVLKMYYVLLTKLTDKIFNYVHVYLAAFPINPYSIYKLTVKITSSKLLFM